MSVIAREADGSAWATARQGMEQAAADLNVELRFLYPGQSDSAQEQEQLLRREVESGASAILLFPADREALAQEVRAASSRAALVTLETDMADTAGYVGVDNAALGEALGRAALNGVPRGETVLLVLAVMVYYGARKWYYYAIPLAMVGIVYYVFKVLLHVSLP